MNRRDFIISAAIATSDLALNAQSHNRATTPSSISSTSDGNAGDLSRVWLSKASLYHDALLPGVGFSFLYGGQPPGCPVTISERKLDSFAEATFLYHSGIEVVRTVTQFPSHGAVEYSIRLRNVGKVRSSIIHDIHTLDLGFGHEALHGSYVVSSGGGMAESVYPPKTFNIAEHIFGAGVPVDGGVLLTTRGGRSSNLDLPFYFVQNDQRSAGLFVAIGWTGQWASDIQANFGEGHLRLRGGIPDIHIALDPGEEITGPRILVGSYDGPLPSGSNLLRKLIREHYTPRLDGKQFGPIATYDTWWNIGEHYDEASLRPLVDTAASIGQEYFLLDAGWYQNSSGPEGFSAGLGNWEEVDRAKFPGGLARFADYVRSRDLKFGLWFEPERVARDTLLAKQHPEWITWLDGAEHGLLDYGRKDVQDWAREMLSGYIEKLAIKYIRHDFNLDPLAYWDSRDTPDRRGLSQIKHIEGFYNVIDWVRDRHPGTVLECCASGGRRIDLETARRFHTFWISDYTIAPEIIRFHLQGINHFLPGNYHYVCYTLPIAEQKEFQPTNLDYLSFFGGAFGTGGRIDLWPDEQRNKFIRLADQYNKVRSYLLKDYYPLLPQSKDLASWNALQFHDPESNAGFVEVFRGRDKSGSRKIALFGLNVKDVYEFDSPLTGNKLRMSGESAMEEGMSFKLSVMGAAMLTYRAI